MKARQAWVHFWTPVYLLKETTMKNDLQTESLRQLLLAQKYQLLEQGKQERGGLAGRSEAAASQLAATEQSHAQNITERDTAFALQEHGMAELEAVVQALGRIARNAYGLCLDCDKEIPIKPYMHYHAPFR
jgi:DnaK suppressor protein